MMKGQYMKRIINKIKLEISIAASAILLQIGIGTLLFKRLESWKWIQSFYFSVVTLTTVGYGDISPTTDKSRLFAAIYILIGVAVVVTALGKIGTDIIKKREEKYKKPPV